MTTKTWIIFVSICAVILAGFFWMSQSNRVNVDTVDLQAIQTETDASGGIGDHVYGNKAAKVRIIEYGDYQCPGCQSAAPILKAVVDKYKDNVVLVFRNFPLPMHGNARTAAAVAEAAGLQGKYWEMHDNLYSLQNDWSNLSGQNRLDTFTSYAEGLGLNRDKFLADIESKNVLAKINFDKALGAKAKVTSTPSISVNGEAADKSVKDGKLVAANNTDPLVWSTQELFETHMIIPALKKAGVAVDDK